MKHTALEIINKSLSIASIDNSSAISYADKIQLLNDTYTELYQWSINAGEKNFIRKGILLGNGGTYRLPNDFWQLELIEINGSPYFGDYEIINGKLIINEGGNNCNISYYTKPVYLSIPSDSIDLDLDIKGNISNGYGKYLLTTQLFTETVDDEEVTSTNIYIYNLETKETIYEVTVNGNVSAFMYKNNFYVINGNSFTLYDLKGEALFNSSFVKISVNQDLCYTNSDGFVIDSYGRWIYNTADDIQSLLYNEDLGLLLINDTLIDVDQETETTYNIPVNTTPLWIGLFNDKPVIYAVSDKNEKMTITANGVYYDRFPLDGRIKKAIALKASEDTGYGYLVDDGSLHLCSCIPDTELNFPNNFYYSLLIYKLAKKYCAKLNVDNTRLDELEAEAEHTYYNTLQTNISKNNKIIDVYENTRRF